MAKNKETQSNVSSSWGSTKEEQLKKLGAAQSRARQESLVKMGSRKAAENERMLQEQEEQLEDKEAFEAAVKGGALSQEDIAGLADPNANPNWKKAVIKGAEAQGKEILKKREKGSESKEPTRQRERAGKADAEPQTPETYRDFVKLVENQETALLKKEEIDAEIKKEIEAQINPIIKNLEHAKNEFKDDTYKGIAKSTADMVKDYQLKIAQAMALYVESQRQLEAAQGHRELLQEFKANQDKARKSVAKLAQVGEAAPSISVQSDKEVNDLVSKMEKVKGNREKKRNDCAKQVEQLVEQCQQEVIQLKAELERLKKKLQEKLDSAEDELSELDSSNAEQAKLIHVWEGVRKTAEGALQSIVNLEEEQESWLKNVQDIREEYNVEKSIIE